MKIYTKRKKKTPMIESIEMWCYKWISWVKFDIDSRNFVFREERNGCLKDVLTVSHKQLPELKELFYRYIKRRHITFIDIDEFIDLLKKVNIPEIEVLQALCKD